MLYYSNRVGEGRMRRKMLGPLICVISKFMARTFTDVFTTPASNSISVRSIEAQSANEDTGLTLQLSVIKEVKYSS